MFIIYLFINYFKNYTLIKLKELEKKQEEERIRMENIFNGNPLKNYSSQIPKTDFKV